MINFLRGVYQCPGTDTGIVDALASIFGADAAGAAATDIGATALAAEGAADVALPTIAITAPAAAATGIGIGDAAAAGLGAAGLGAAAGGALGGAGGGGPIGGDVGSPVSTGSPGGDLSSADIAQAAQIGPQTLASNAPLSADISSTPGVLMPTTDASVSSLPPDVAQSLGVGAPTGTGTGAGAGGDVFSLTNPTPAFPDAGGPVGGAGGAGGAGGGTAPWGGDALTFDPNNPLQLPAAGGSGAAAPANPSWSGQLGKWLSNPKNDITAGMLGLSAVNALSTPKLPGAAQTALGAAGPAVQQAQAMIQAGGMAGPIWTQQKASIDASIDQQIAQLKQQIQQNASNMGAGGANSGLVQQQISQQVAQLEQQRQTLYAQAAEQNVQNAVAELTGGNQTLGGIAQLQYNQQQQAQQSAQKLAQLAALINQSSVPGG